MSQSPAGSIDQPQQPPPEPPDLPMGPVGRPNSRYAQVRRHNRKYVARLKKKKEAEIEAEITAGLKR